MNKDLIIKVCGMQDEENIQQVAALGVNMLGFIFYPQSPRYALKDLGDKEILNFIHNDNTKSLINRVGVFVNEGFNNIVEIAEKYQLNYIQLHGGESVEMCRQLKSRGYKIIKVFSIETEEDIAQTADFENCADFFLFDTKCKNYGGSGKTFNWEILNAYTGNTPFILSGGISMESIEAIKAFYHPRFAGIDLNSGFEIAPALKDVNKLELFINEIRDKLRK